ncbi:ROK family protein [Microlunatus sp. Gsoil 973]|jgi:glucokinase|uniref:ROK family protein n=1 Tax=Microlunatus sp. Gsoil 973 TaxID=2672569 RepID=UPI0012B4CB37|nr:ROK family protein [Microlunatus sp. Gsoil 973]QGN31886.1 ROK family protein [Microlunatus sp. Gsoil 973]
MAKEPDPTESVLAIDIGGTKIAIAVVAADGTITHEARVPTLRDQDADATFAPLADGIAEIISQPGLQGTALRVGIGSAGPIDSPGGWISPVNIPAWRQYPIVAKVAEAVRAATGAEPAVGLAQDGHCMALGEHWLGAGKDLHSMVGMVLSTGVGAGAVINDRLFGGLTGNAVLLGHISVNAWGEECVCGGHGCVEMYARGPAMVQAAKAAGWTGGDDAVALTAAARSGNEIARTVIDNGMRALAAGIAATATLLDVPDFVLGGGVSKAGEVIFEPLRRHIAEFATMSYVKDLRVRPAQLENAGLLGAAALALSL